MFVCKDHLKKKLWKLINNHLHTLELLPADTFSQIWTLPAMSKVPLKSPDEKRLLTSATCRIKKQYVIHTRCLKKIWGPKKKVAPQHQPTPWKICRHFYELFVVFSYTILLSLLPCCCWRPGLRKSKVTNHFWQHT